MTGILKKIVDYKRAFVEECKSRIPLREIKAMAADTSPTRGFADALADDGCSLIAEIKTASPSRGIIRENANIADIARLYETNGASCISVLTDEKYFQGSLDRLTVVRQAVNIPLLRKDFIIDPYQIVEARVAGADAVLLIAACLDDETIRDLIGIATKLQLDCLVEVHDLEELERVKSLPLRLVGVNNRDLTTFETNTETTGRLAGEIPDGVLLVSESGIFTAGDVSHVHLMGADAVLVGEAIMRESDIGAKVCELANATKKHTQPQYITSHKPFGGNSHE